MRDTGDEVISNAGNQVWIQQQLLFGIRDRGTDGVLRRHASL
jgi:hypothetical protein